LDAVAEAQEQLQKTIADTSGRLRSFALSSAFSNIAGRANRNNMSNRNFTACPAPSKKSLIKTDRSKQAKVV
jgi:hypothetical protein